MLFITMSLIILLSGISTFFTTCGTDKDILFPEFSTQDGQPEYISLSSSNYCIDCNSVTCLSELIKTKGIKEANMIKHMKNNHPEKMRDGRDIYRSYKCKKCSNSHYTDYIWYVYHYFNIHNKEKNTIPERYLQFQYKKDPISKGSPRLCPLCGQVFDRLQALRKHLVVAPHCNRNTGEIIAPLSVLNEKISTQHNKSLLILNNNQGHNSISDPIGQDEEKDILSKEIVNEAAEILMSLKKAPSPSGTPIKKRWKMKENLKPSIFIDKLKIPGTLN